MIKEYFYKVGYGDPRAERTGLIRTSIPEGEIEAWLREQAIENAEDYGYYQDEDYFGDLDHVGHDGCELEGYLSEGFLEYLFEPYNPEEHDEELVCKFWEEL